MPLFSLQEVDQRSVSITLAVNDRQAVLIGLATYHAQSEFGPCLIIAVKDPAGDFELVLHEGVSEIKIEPGGDSGAEFQIALATQSENPSCVEQTAETEAPLGTFAPE